MVGPSHAPVVFGRVNYAALWCAAVGLCKVVYGRVGSGVGVVSSGAPRWAGVG